MKKFLGNTWYGWLNVIFLQWFFIRLARIIDSKPSKKWIILKWIIPCTGWWNNFKYVGKKK